MSSMAAIAELLEKILQEQKRTNEKLRDVADVLSRIKR